MFTLEGVNDSMQVRSELLQLAAARGEITPADAVRAVRGGKAMCDILLSHCTVDLGDLVAAKFESTQIEGATITPDGVMCVEAPAAREPMPETDAEHLNAHGVFIAPEPKRAR